MFCLTKWLEVAPYSLKKSEKTLAFASTLKLLTTHHYDHCLEYKKVVDALKFDFSRQFTLENTPFLPARIFKHVDLMSCDKNQIIKTMNSSGTSGQMPARIYLDNLTASNQTKALCKIVSHFTGKDRLPLLVIDSKSTIENRNQFTARAAGIKGFSFLGKNITFALNDAMELDLDTVFNFERTHKGGASLIFGFSSLIWSKFVTGLDKARVDFSNSILIHGGGWKKLQDVCVSNIEFSRRLFNLCGLRKVYNYYGMVEQAGSIFMACEEGRLHCSSFSDIIIRNEHLQSCSYNQRGMIEVLSLLPTSYPGHAILTEDEGEILGEDDCPCGRFGKTFKVYGRMPLAEVRGCSDTIAA